MKVANILGTVNIANHCNGTAAFARDVIAGLQKKGWEATFFSPSNHNENSKVHVFFGKIKRRLFHAAIKYKMSFMFVVLLKINFSQFFRQLSKKKLEGVFLCNDVLCAQVALLLTKKNVVLVTHFAIPPWDEFVRGGFISRKSFGYYILRKWMLSVFNNERLRFIFISEVTKKLVCQLVPNASKRGKLIYNGVGVQSISESVSVVAGKKYIVNVGALNENKNQELFLKVAAVLNKKLPDLYFVLVGDGDSTYVSLLKQQVMDKGLSKRVIFTGMLAQRETYAVMSSAELYLHTSKYESFGRVLIEAIGHGVITCCMEYPAAYEIIGDDVDLIFPVSFPPELISDKIYSLLSNQELLVKKKKDQKKFFLETFSVDRMINKIECYLFDETNNL